MELNKLRNLIIDVQELSINKVNFDTDIALGSGFTEDEKREAEQIIIHSPKQTPAYKDVQMTILRFCFGRQVLPEIFYIEEAKLVYLFFPRQGKYFMAYEEELWLRLEEIYLAL
jgi:hypothetical protein